MDYGLTLNEERMKGALIEIGMRSYLAARSPRPDPAVIDAQVDDASKVPFELNRLNALARGKEVADGIFRKHGL